MNKRNWPKITGFYRWCYADYFNSKSMEIEKKSYDFLMENISYFFKFFQYVRISSTFSDFSKPNKVQIFLDIPSQRDMNIASFKK